MQKEIPYLSPYSIVGLITVLCLASCCAIPSTVMPTTTRSPYPPICDEPHEFSNRTVLFIHGLNQDPNSLSSYAELFKKKGYNTCFAVLTAHSKKMLPNDWHLSSLEQWREDLISQIREIRTRFPHSSLSFVAFSVGAPLIVDLIDHYPEQSPEKLIFIAPAFALRWTSKLPRLLTPFKFLGLSLPSLAPKKYRVGSSTSLYSYAAAYELIEATSSLINPHHLNSIPALILLSAKDEVVSIDGIKKWSKEHKLDTWRLKEVRIEKKDTWHHLLINADEVGESSWNEITQAILHFIGEI